MSLFGRLRREPRIAVIAALLFGSAMVAGSVSGTPAPAEAAQSGQILYSPNLSTFPSGTVGYPRAIRVDHDGSSAQTMLATFAQGGHNGPGTMPIYRSTDAGASWSQISSISSHTAGWTIEAPTIFEVPRTIPASTRETSSRQEPPGPRGTTRSRRSRSSAAPTRARPGATSRTAPRHPGFRIPSATASGSRASSSPTTTHSRASSLTSDLPTRRRTIRTSFTTRRRTGARHGAEPRPRMSHSPPTTCAAPACRRSPSCRTDSS